MRERRRQPLDPLIQEPRRDKRRPNVESASGNPQIVRANTIGERVANLAAGEPVFRNLGQKGIRDRSHRR